jgi:hypothetical protein
MVTKTVAKELQGGRGGLFTQKQSPEEGFEKYCNTCHLP